MHFLAARRGNVDPDAALAPVGMLHQRMPVRVDLDAAHVEEAALGVAAHRVLDLDDVRAPVGEDRSRRRDERELRELQDPKALHHLDHFGTYFGVECHRKRRRRTEGLTVDVRVAIGQQVDVGQPIQQAFERDPGFQPRQVQTQAGVLAGGEGDVRHVLAEDVEFFRTFPAPLVAIRRTHAHADRRARRNRDPFQLGVFGGEPLHRGQRRLEAQPFLDRLARSARGRLAPRRTGPGE